MRSNSERKIKEIKQSIKTYSLNDFWQIFEVKTKKNAKNFKLAIKIYI